MRKNDLYRIDQEIRDKSGYHPDLYRRQQAAYDDFMLFDGEEVSGDTGYNGYFKVSDTSETIGEGEEAVFVPSVIVSSGIFSTGDGIKSIDATPISINVTSKIYIFLELWTTADNNAAENLQYNYVQSTIWKNVELRSFGELSRYVLPVPIAEINKVGVDAITITQIQHGIAKPWGVLP